MIRNVTIYPNNSKAPYKKKLRIRNIGRNIQFSIVVLHMSYVISGSGVSWR